MENVLSIRLLFAESNKKQTGTLKPAALALKRKGKLELPKKIVKPKA
jgi:hypothetical protein